MLIILSLLHKFLIVLVPFTIFHGIFTYGRTKNKKKMFIFFVLLVIFFVLSVVFNIQITSTVVYSIKDWFIMNRNDVLSIFMYITLGVYFCNLCKISKIRMFISIFLFNMYIDIAVRVVLGWYVFLILTGKEMSVGYINNIDLIMLKVDIIEYLIILISYLFIYNIYKYLDKKYKFSEDNMKSYVYIFIIFVGDFLCVLTLLVLKKFDSLDFLRIKYDIEMLRDFVLKYLIYANIITIIFILIDIVKRNKINTQNKSIETRLDAQLSHYAEVKETHLKVRKLYHDINNHICCLENLNTSNEETNTYINNLKSEIIDFKKIYDTGNILLDTIVNEKSLVCEKKGIEFSCNIDFSEIDFLEPIDISAIFANILDNAIEACEKMHKLEQKKYIKIRGTINRSFYVITCKNSKANEIMIEKNRLSTSKANKFVHGLGILSIESALKKYNGRADFNGLNDSFRANIYIPLNKDEREVEI